MASLGLPIDNDPLYPDAVDVTPDDFSHPLQLLAYSLEFDGPRKWTPQRVRQRTHALMFVAVRVNFSKLKPLPLSITDQNGTPAATIVTSATRRRP